MTSPRLREGAGYLAALCAVGASALAVKLAAGPVINPDTFFHLRLGAEFLDGWPPQAPGTVTTYASAPWIPTQWLGQIALASTERTLGLTGVAALTGVSVALLCAALFLATRAVSSFTVAAWTLPVVLFACVPYLSGRPQLVSYALVAIVTAGWIRSWRNSTVPWWIVPLTWIWAMTHGMWSASVVISTTAVLGMCIDRRVSVDRAWRFLAVPLLSLAAALLTPMGPGLVTAAQRVGAITHYFSEWRPTDFTSGTTLAAAALAVAFIIQLGRRGEATPWTLLLLFVLALAWLGYAMRTVPVAAAMLGPLLAALLTLDTPESPRARWHWPVATISLAGLLAIAVTTALGTASDPRSTSPAHASVAALEPGTPLLTAWGLGGYDMWRHPDLNITAHGYGDMFTDAELRRNDALRTLETGWVQDLTNLDVQHALLPVESALADELTNHLGWSVVAEDPSPLPGYQLEPLAHLVAPASEQP